MRQIILDTETTGLSAAQGHRIIEIGAIELVNRRKTGNHLHYYINPERTIEFAAQEVHGITSEFLRDKPLFKDIVDEFVQFVSGAELIIHNAPFDIGFINSELKLVQHQINDIMLQCAIIDTLAIARNKHPGLKNSLDALCRRYHVDNSGRELHGALLDAELLADVYLAMTGGQTSLFVDELVGEQSTIIQPMQTMQQLANKRPALPVIAASVQELDAHAKFLQLLAKKSGQTVIWEDATAYP